MKPDSSSPSGENPASPKPDAESSARPSPVSEKDLWDFDDEPDEPIKKPDSKPKEESASSAGNEEVPAGITITPRGPRRDSLPFKQTPVKKKQPVSEEIPDEPESSAAPAAPATKLQKTAETELKPAESTFDELEKSAEEETRKPEPVQEPEIKAPAKTAPDEPAPAVAKGFSKIEKIGILAFLVLILAGGLFFVAHSISKLPEKERILNASDFPIKGTKVETLSFKSYWRDPVVSGDNADTVRRGTIIIPVVELKVSGGPAAIRVFFRNSDGDTIGDAVSRPVNGEGTLVLPATAGFYEPGMYAAYRTGEAKSWKVEVFEGPTPDASGSDFKKLFEIPISTNRR